MSKILLMVGVFLLPFINAFAAIEQPLPTPVPENSYYAYEAPPSTATTIERGQGDRHVQEHNATVPAAPQQGEDIDFLGGLTARKQGDITYFSSGVICQGKDDIIVCN